MSELAKLPLWKGCLERMRADGVHYGKVYATEFFEEQLRERRDTVQFDTAVAEIRKRLETDGFYITSRGNSGAQYHVLSPDESVEQSKNHARVGVGFIRRAMTLGSNIDTSLLSDDKRRKLESHLQKTGTRLALLSRSTQAAAIIRASKPELLK